MRHTLWINALLDIFFSYFESPNVSIIEALRSRTYISKLHPVITGVRSEGMVTGYSTPANEANKTSFLNRYKHCGGFAAPWRCESAGSFSSGGQFCVFFGMC